MPYKIQSKLFYKIWFSNDENVFLPENNQERFKTFITNTDQSQTVYFIYSSASLNKLALEKLEIFCKEHNIIPIDFKNIIAQGDELDKNIHNLVSLELDLWINDKGGNPGVASDFLRWSKYVIKKFGIYSDFDVTVIPKFLNDNIDIDMPILFPTCSAGFNNDFMAFAYDANSQDIEANTKELITQFQQDIIERSANLKKSIIESDCLFPSNRLGELYAQSAKEFIEGKQIVPTIHEFRKHLIDSIRDNPDNSDNANTLFQISVMTMVGPGSLNRLIPMIKSYFSLQDGYSDIKTLCSISRSMSKNNAEFYLKFEYGDASWIKNGISVINKVNSESNHVGQSSSLVTLEKTQNEKETLANNFSKILTDTIEICIGVDIAVDTYRAIYDPTKENMYKLSYDIGLMASMLSKSFSPSLLISPTVANDLLNAKYFNAAFHIFQNVIIIKAALDLSSKMGSPLAFAAIGGAIQFYSMSSNIINLYNQHNDLEYAKIAQEHRVEIIDYIKETSCYFVGDLFGFCDELS